jgi:hypothetical protein
MSKIIIKSFFDEITKAVIHCVTDSATGYTAIVDPFLGHHIVSGKPTTTLIDAIIAYVEQQNFHVQWILQTNISDADTSAANYIKRMVGGQIGVGSEAEFETAVSKHTKIFGSNHNQPSYQFDLLFSDNELIALGHIKILVMHTGSSFSSLIADAVFVGATFLKSTPENVSCITPKGDANVHLTDNILSLPNATRVFIKNGVKAPYNCGYKWEFTIIEEKLKLRTNVVHNKYAYADTSFISQHTHRYSMRSKNEELSS